MNKRERREKRERKALSQMKRQTYVLPTLSKKGENSPFFLLSQTPFLKNLLSDPDGLKSRGDCNLDQHEAARP